MDNTENISKEEQSAINMFKEYLKRPLYILLSAVEADMVSGISIPYVEMNAKGGRRLLIFTEYEYAVEYIEKKGMDDMDKTYPIAQFMADDETNGLGNIAAIAANMGILFIFFNPGIEYMELGTTIPWLQKIEGYDLVNFNQAVTAEEREKYKDNPSKIPISFIPMRIHNFKNPYNISEERYKEICDIAKTTFDGPEAFANAIREMKLPELVALSRVLSAYINQSHKDGQEDNEFIYRSMFALLWRVITQYLYTLQMYTIIDNDEYFIDENKNAYLVFTDRFQFMGEYRYKETTLEEFINIVEAKGAQGVWVTDGPGVRAATTIEFLKECLNVVKQKEAEMAKSEEEDNE